MEEVKTKRIETEVNQGKIDYINYAHNRQVIITGSFFDKLEAQAPWKHMFFCAFEDCISYFGESVTA